MLADDAIDIGLVGMPEHKTGFIYENLVEIEDIFVATSTYMSHLPQDMTSTREILEASTLMLLDKNNMTRQYIDDYLAKNQIQTKDYIEISNMDLLIEFAKIGVGVPDVIKNFVQEELADGQLQQIPLDIPIHKRDVGFAYKKTHLQNDALSCFLDFAVARQCDSKLRGSRWLAGGQGMGWAQYAAANLGAGYVSLFEKGFA